MTKVHKVVRWLVVLAILIFTTLVSAGVVLAGPVEWT
jgi:hypothetical protein